MLKLLRITCVWLYFASCIHSPFVAAVPLEYIDDHEQLSYDMDTEQSKAKYDPRLLTDQLLSDAKDAAEERAFKVQEEPQVSRQHHHHHHHQHQQQQQKQQQQRAQQKLSPDDDFQPHEKAAACHSSGIKYTHGQKVPRLDPCEVCLCVDGEIFCWWKKCGVTRKKSIAETHSNPRQAADSWKSKKFRVTAATTTKLTTKQRRPKYKEQQLQHVAKSSEERQQVEETKSQHAEHKKMQQKLKYRQQQKQKEQQLQQEQRQMEQAEQQLQLQLQVEMKHQREQENIMRLRQQQQRERQQQQEHHTSNKILNFPENLPSLLYYDYKTEEHQHLQHQHHQQHLKHQQERRQQQQQLQQQLHEQPYEQQQLEESLSQHEEHSHTGSSFERTTATSTSKTDPETSVYKQQHKSNRIQVGNKAQHEDAEDEADEENEQQQQATDSDILPEPPTKKPKVTAPETITTTTTIIKTTESSNQPSKHLSEQQEPQQLPPWQEIPTTDTKNSFCDNYSLRNQDDNNSNNDNNNAITKTSPAATEKNSASSKNFEEMHLNVDNRDVDISHGINNKYSNNDDGIIGADNEDDNDNDDVHEDDDFHRWLSSTESYNNKSKVYGEARFDSKQTTELEPRTPETDVAETETEAEAEAVSEEAVNPYATKLITTSPTNSNINSHRPPEYVQQTRAHSDMIDHESNAASSMGEGGGDAAASGFFRSSYNDFSSEFNGSVVNIDIMLTAGQDEQQQKQQQRQQEQQIEKQQQQPQQQQQLQQSQSFVLQADLIANASKAAQIAATSTAEITAGADLSNNVVNASMKASTTTTTVAVGAAAASLLLDGAPTGSNQSSSTAATLRVASPESVTLADKQCNVMGTLYKIGDVLPQETGNCLQCICIDGGSTKDDTPRVTCSPHNCPPLVLPDLFDATGY